MHALHATVSSLVQPYPRRLTVLQLCVRGIPELRRLSARTAIVSARSSLRNGMTDHDKERVDCCVPLQRRRNSLRALSFSGQFPLPSWPLTPRKSLAKLAAHRRLLGELEALLEPLFAAPLPETLPCPRTTPAGQAPDRPTVHRLRPHFQCVLLPPMLR